MNGPLRPVIIFHGRNEFEAQMARDILESAMIPVIHIPSLSTGIFGVPETTRIAVPEDYVEDAIEELREQGLNARVMTTPRGLSMFEESVREKLPVDRGMRLPQGSHLRRVMTAIVLAIVGLILWAVLRRR